MQELWKYEKRVFSLSVQQLFPIATHYKTETFSFLLTQAKLHFGCFGLILTNLVYSILSFLLVCIFSFIPLNSFPRYQNVLRYFCIGAICLVHFDCWRLKQAKNRVKLIYLCFVMLLQTTGWLVYLFFIMYENITFCI